MTQLPLSTDLLHPLDSGAAVSSSRRIHCNRNTRLDHVSLIGFDMDYTLAVYRQAEIDRLSIEATAKKLVTDCGYPDSLLSMPYRTDFPIRGLLIDTKLGNVLKMDRYKYVKVAFHGFRRMPAEERRRLYHTKRLRPGTQRYHWVDTLYALSEVSVYAAAIEELERDGGTVDYAKLFADVRRSIDLAHQDGTILDVVARDFGKYVLRDELLGPTLHKFRSAGKKLFLLTNSRATYTDAMMRYLLDGQVHEYASWRNYFDVIVTASKKPGFFTGDAPFRELKADGTEGEVTHLERGHLYSGGNIVDFERLAGFGGDHVLYIGDHIYGDVLRAKKETAWRTTMIIQEMPAELDALRRCAPLHARLDALERLDDQLSEELRAQQAELKVAERQIAALDLGERDSVPPELEAARVRMRRAIEKTRARMRDTAAELDRLEDEISAAFHPHFGSLFKAGPEISLFGNQVETYACLYTDRVSNFLSYAPTHYFRSPRDRMPHER